MKVRRIDDFGEIVPDELELRRQFSVTKLMSSELVEFIELATAKAQTMSAELRNSLAQLFLSAERESRDHNPLAISGNSSNFTLPIDVDGGHAPGEPLLEQDDSWSIIWYIASFSGLIAFFLIVSCSEWCCRMHVRAAPASLPPARPPGTSSGTQTPATGPGVGSVESPPPAYDLFAPPSYDSLARAAEKSEFDVFVVPVHAIRMLQEAKQDPPPSYISVQMQAS